jgi:hypothetical protein
LKTEEGGRKSNCYALKQQAQPVLARAPQEEERKKEQGNTSLLKKKKKKKNPWAPSELQLGLIKVTDMFKKKGGGGSGNMFLITLWNFSLGDACAWCPGQGGGAKHDSGGCCKDPLAGRGENSWGSLCRE